MAVLVTYAPVHGGFVSVYVSVCNVSVSFQLVRKFVGEVMNWQVLIILLFVAMFIGSYLVAKANSNFGRKIFCVSAIFCASILFLTGCGSKSSEPPPTSQT